MIVGALFLLLLIFQLPAGAVRLLLPAQAGVSGLGNPLVRPGNQMLVGDNR